MTAYQLCIPGWWVLAIVTLLLLKFATEIYLAVRVYRLLNDHDYIGTARANEYRLRMDHDLSLHDIGGKP